MKLLFASANQHKIEEIQSFLPSNIELITLSDLGFIEEIPETSETIEGNALQKATFLFERFQIPCFADDSGLIIPAINGEPGVNSAHYAGPQRSAVDNIKLVQMKLADKMERTAYFTTVIAYIDHNGSALFHGEIHGAILNQSKGTKGFGYDPIFVPNGEKLSFAEMESEQKNANSHRSIACEKLFSFLKSK